MSSGWPQDQQQLRWPRAPHDDAWPPAGDAGGDEPGPYAAGREAADPWAAGQGFGDPWSTGNGVPASWDAAPVDAGPGGGAAWDGGRAAGRGRQQGGQAVPPPPQDRQPPRQDRPPGRPDRPPSRPAQQPDRLPDSGLDGDEEYDWYRYLSNGGSPPSHSDGPSGPAAGGAGPGADRAEPAPRAARKSRDKRKTRRERKNRGPDDGPLTAWQSDEGESAPPYETGPQRASGPAAYVGPPGDAADTGPGNGWRAYPGSVPAGLASAPSAAGFRQPPYLGQAAGPDDTGPQRRGRPAAYAGPPGDAGFRQPSYPGQAAGPDDSGPRRGSGAAAYAGPPGDAGFRQPSYPSGQAFRPDETGPQRRGGPAAYAGPPGDAADTGPGNGWRAYPGSAAGPAPYPDSGFRQPSYPVPAAPVPASPAHWPGGSQDPQNFPVQASAAQASAPRGFDHPADAADAYDTRGHQFVREPAATVAKRPAKRGRKALRPPSARAVRRAVHPDVLERARIVAAAGATGSAALAAPPDVAERPVQPGQLVRPAWPTGPGDAGRRGGAERPAKAGQAAAPGQAGRPSQPGRARSGKRLRRRVLWLTAGVAVIIMAAAALLLRPGPGPAHVLVTPARLGAYAKEPHLAKAMDAGQLQQDVVTKSAGEAKHVVYAVYEDSTGPAARSGPQIILFIGGNLTGTSPTGFISSFVGEARGGAQRTSAGSMGGEAACVSRVPGSVAECAWADNDTFGVVASPTLSVSALAAELRAARPQVEHPAG
jgi:hypothetical protein